MTLPVVTSRAPLCQIYLQFQNVVGRYDVGKSCDVPEERLTSDDSERLCQQDLVDQCALLHRRL